MSLSKFVLLLGGMSVGKHVSSSKFGPSGHDWQVRFYPDGVTEDFAGNVSVYLCYLGQAKHVRARFTLTMLEKQGKVEVMHVFFSIWGLEKLLLSHDIIARNCNAYSNP
jgi:hypothetical protein